MRSRNEYISLMKSKTDVLRQRFEVRSLRLFGSVARNQQSNNSDVDVCVEMPPKLYPLIELGAYLEELLGCHVDVVRMHNNMNSLLLKEIEKDGIYVFR